MNDKKDAVEIYIGISKELIRASLTMMTVEVAYVAYVFKERTSQDGFICNAVLVGVFAISSIVLGGYGIAKNARKGANGNWELETGEVFYKLQFLSCLLGIISFATMILLQGPKKSDSGIEYQIQNSVSENLGRIEQQLKQVNGHLDREFQLDKAPNISNDTSHIEE